MRPIEDHQSELNEVLGEAESWLRQLQVSPNLPYGPPGLEQDEEAIRQLRKRAESDLLSVAMFGGSSSGKSFLASGLLGGLEFLRVDSVEGVPSDKYLGLLPFATTPTTMCPARVVPANETNFDASGRGFMRVRFIGSGEFDWEDIGNSPAPAVVAAYAMYRGDIANRRRDHIQKEVAEIEILFSNSMLPAQLYDLPGYGSVNPNHERIAKEATAAADCLIYVANATRALTANAKDLELIRFLYEHHTLTRKRVVWVLTAIDKAMDLNIENEPSWKETLAANNDYLRQNFTHQDGRPDTAFIGRGFIPVSPALEAQGRRFIAAGDETHGQTLMAASNMDDLRVTLRAVIAEGAGQRHLSDIAAEAGAIVAPRQRVIRGRLDAERLPYEELTAQRTAIEEQLTSLDLIVDETKSHLESLLLQRIRTATRPFGKLAAHLHEHMDDDIRSADPRNPKEANRLEVRKSQITYAWLTGATGPAKKWEVEYASFQRATSSYIHSKLGTAGPGASLASPQPLEVKRLTAPRIVRKQMTPSDLLQKTAIFVTAATPISAGATWAITAVAVSTIVWPAAAVTAVGAITFTTISALRSRKASLSKERQELIDDIDNEAAKYKEAFTVAVEEQGRLVIDNAQDYLADYRTDLERNLETVRERIAEPEIASRIELIRQLEPLDLKASKLVKSLRKLTDW
jgi:hypothetical protein